MNPVEFWENSKKFPLTHLAVCRFQEGESNLRFIIRARKAAWEQSRGNISAEDREIIRMAKIGI